MKQFTEEEAMAFAESGLWNAMTAHQKASFQLFQNRLCMPFGEFHKAVEVALGRPVYTHEFGLNRKGLQAELDGTGLAPDLTRIIAMLPAGKTVVVIS